MVFKGGEKMNIMEYEETKTAILYTIIIGMIVTLIGSWIMFTYNFYEGAKIAIGGLVLIVTGISIDFVIDNFRELQF